MIATDTAVKGALHDTIELLSCMLRNQRAFTDALQKHNTDLTLRNRELCVDLKEAEAILKSTEAEIDQLKEKLASVKSVVQDEDSCYDPNEPNEGEGEFNW